MFCNDEHQVTYQAFISDIYFFTVLGLPAALTTTIFSETTAEPVLNDFEGRFSPLFFNVSSTANCETDLYKVHDKFTSIHTLN